ncbi:lysophospholipase [Flavobacterium rivuli WB 3.3-2 = DSM 21788]|uniref:Lysophospholipase n=1 Tax=Flavobacterium rivuli WB 3.3-2 = DSM 21788 TaxID=1121895 RepID=A0A0A2M3G6_9FLAO|nr:rhamnogalacturonan acetylesterase [Flavobacterium rivuli]KGO86814.1 lysophospholipase [Flavobacterium rivuli WB 3.3-2 = DSM 21788]
MKITNHFVTTAILLLSVFCLSFSSFKAKPTLYIIGDSTVKNGSGNGADSLWGWGSFMEKYIDTTKIDIQNHAIGGRSSRTFLTDGRWDKILETLKKDDYVMMQFGHNDGGPLDDTARARGTLQGVGNDSTEIFNPIRKVNETVHSYGWYMKKYANEAKAKGATVIICSPVPRSDFNEKGKIGVDKYAAWAKDVAQQTDAYFIPLNDLVIAEYEKIGIAATKSYFPKDHTHTNKAGAQLNAQLVVKGLQQLKGCKVNKYIIK